MQTNLTYLCGKQKVKVLTIELLVASQLLFYGFNPFILLKKKDNKLFLEMPF